MSLYPYLDAYHTKTAAPSNYAQDFAAGLDPFGFWTADYGMKGERAGLSEKEHALKRGLGTAGGIVGGGALVPGAISGISGAVKGFAESPGGIGKRLGGAVSGGIEGAAAPFKSLHSAFTANKGLKRLAAGGDALSAAERAAVHSVGEKTPLSAILGPLSKLKGKKFDDASQPSLKMLAGQLLSSPGGGAEMAKRVQPEIQSAMTKGLTGMGLGGAVGGFGAFAQYGKGREAERETGLGSRLKQLIPFMGDD